jgi:hypothetical protein
LSAQQHLGLHRAGESIAPPGSATSCMFAPAARFTHTREKHPSWWVHWVVGRRSLFLFRPMPSVCVVEGAESFFDIRRDRESGQWVYKLKATCAFCHTDSGLLPRGRTKLANSRFADQFAAPPRPICISGAENKSALCLARCVSINSCKNAALCERSNWFARAFFLSIYACDVGVIVFCRQKGKRKFNVTAKFDY